MNKFYTEQLVSQKATSQTKIKKAMFVGSIVFAIFLCFVSIWTVPFVFATIVLTGMMWRRLDLEYEYNYYKGEVEIDKIMGKKVRKNIFSINVNDMEILAPTGFAQLEMYKNLKTYDCSSNLGNPTYEMVVTKKGEKVRILFEPCEEILNDMKVYAPEKIII